MLCLKSGLVVLVLPLLLTVAAAADDPVDLFRAGRFNAAQSAFADIVNSQREAGRDRSREHAMALFNLGASAAATGDLGEAVLAFRGALAVCEKLSAEDNLDTALALEGLAAVLLQQENLIEAQQSIDRALAVRREHYPDNHPQLARLHALAANAAQLRGDIEGTEELYYKALMAYRRIHGNVHPIVAEIIQNIGTFYTDNGNFQAEIMFRQADDVGRELYGPWHPLRAASLANLGRLRWTEGRFAESEQYLRDALAIHDHLGARSRPDLAVCLYQLGRTLLAQDRSGDAVAVLERAATVYESAWWRAGAGSERSLAVMSPYPLLAEANLELGRQAEALQAFHAHQGRLSALSSRLRDLPGPLAVRRDSLVGELARREEDLARLGTGLPGVGEARAALAAAETDWLRFQQDAASGPDGTPGAADFRQWLRAGEAMVGWQETEIRPGSGRAWAFVVRPERETVWVRLPALETGLGRDLVLAALAEVTGAGDPAADSPLEALGQLVAAPLLEHLDGVGRLIVIPSGFMAGFPAELVFPGDQVVVYAAGLPLARRPVADESFSRAAPRVLVVADPPFCAGQVELAAVATADQVLPDAMVLRSALGGSRAAIETLPRLSGTRREAESLARLFPGTTALLGGRASEGQLRELATGGELGGFDIIHLATHALIDAERPGRSALVLSQLQRTDDPGADGLLTVQEIDRTWRLNAGLVTLSACATGLGRRIDGEGFLGFTQALTGAGARSVLVSLWPVDDRSTALLMERFYGNLAGGSLAPAAALQEARHWLRDYTTPRGTRPFAQPRHWAGFVMFSRLD